MSGEDDWFLVQDYEALLRHIDGSGIDTDRKLRAVINACFFRQRHEMHSSEFIPTIALDNYLAGEISFADMDEIYRNSGQFGDDGAPEHVTVQLALDFIVYVDYFLEDYEEESAERAKLVREIFGNPFQRVRIDPVWLSSNNGRIPKMAQEIYLDRDSQSGHLDNQRLSILADALEEAGCADDSVLSHLRQSGPHVVGCWVLDLLLSHE